MSKNIRADLVWIDVKHDISRHFEIPGCVTAFLESVRLLQSIDSPCMETATYFASRFNVSTRTIRSWIAKAKSRYLLETIDGGSGKIITSTYNNRISGIPAFEERGNATNRIYFELIQRYKLSYVQYVVLSQICQDLNTNLECLDPHSSLPAIRVNKSRIGKTVNESKMTVGNAVNSLVECGLLARSLDKKEYEVDNTFFAHFLKLLNTIVLVDFSTDQSTELSAKLYPFYLARMSNPEVSRTISSTSMPIDNVGVRYE